MNAAELIDDAAGGRVLVFGSPPPEGRDLDVLAPAAEHERISARLRDEGFVSRGDEWARFRDCTAEAVELSRPAEWNLPAGEVERVLERALPLDGLANLVVPAPADDLLVLAKLLAWSGGIFPEKRRARLERALASKGAWEDAERRAAAWGLTAELASLRDPPVSPSRPRRPRRPRVIALSGIDGSGKSTQAKALRETLEGLGYDVAIEWAPLSTNAGLAAIAAPIKALLSRSRKLAAAERNENTGLHHDAGTALRSQSASVRFAWTMLVAFENALWHLRMTSRHALAGRVVIFDRYVLDSAARMRFQYGEEQRFGLQQRLVRLLSPPAVASFYLELPPHVSLERKDDRWTLEDLETQARLYAEESSRLKVTRLDAQRPREELCAEIASTVWRSLA